MRLLLSFLSKARFVQGVNEVALVASGGSLFVATRVDELGLNLPPRWNPSELVRRSANGVGHLLALGPAGEDVGGAVLRVLWKGFIHRLDALCEKINYYEDFPSGWLEGWYRELARGKSCQDFPSGWLEGHPS
jgi:hypothetical protein